jgi:hypothetical protein
MPSLDNVPLHQEVAPSRPWRTIGIASAIFVALWLYGAIGSKGFLEADACTHYLSAHFGIQQPVRIVSVWDRPLFMLLYSIPAAYGGVLGARALSLLLALLCAWTAWRIAARLGMRWAELAFICVLAQPLVYLHSFSEMTELCFAAVIGLAFLAYIDRRWGWMALLLAISPLGRPEGFGFIALGALALLGHRKWQWLPVLPSALLLWTLVGWLCWGRPDYGHGIANFLVWLPKQWPYSGISVYDAGPLFFWKTQPNGNQAGSFLMRLPVLISPLLFPFMLVGTALTFSGWRDRIKTHLGHARLLVAVLPWGILAGHSYLWWRGQMASNGELRYLLVTAPLWGVLTAMGLEYAAPILQNRFSIARKLSPVALSGILALTPVLGNFRFHVVPFKQYEDDLLAEDVAHWYRFDSTLRHDYPRLVSTYIAVYLSMDISPTDQTRTTSIWGKPLVQRNPPGVVLIWDDIYGTKNADTNMCVSRDELLANGWKPVRTFTRGSRAWEAFVSRDQANGEHP